MGTQLEKIRQRSVHAAKSLGRLLAALVALVAVVVLAVVLAVLAVVSLAVVLARGRVVVAISQSQDRLLAVVAALAVLAVVPVAVLAVVLLAVAMEDATVVISLTSAVACMLIRAARICGSPPTWSLLIRIRARLVTTLKGLLTTPVQTALEYSSIHICPQTIYTSDVMVGSCIFQKVTILGSCTSRTRHQI